MTLAARHGVIVVAREVLIPVLLDKLEELEIILHLAFYQRFYSNGLIDLMLRKCICSVSVCGGRRGAPHRSSADKKEASTYSAIS